MKYNLQLLNMDVVQQPVLDEIIKLNELTMQHGLILSQTQVLQLVESRNISLSANGRIEIGNSTIEKIICAFYDSPYINQNIYADTIKNLVEIFFYYKNETHDLISDDELIKYMVAYYNGTCAGSIELLSSRELDKLVRNLRQGLPLDNDT